MSTALELALVAWLVAFGAAASGDGSGGGGSVPAALAAASQLIAREGNCVLIDCNVSGDPFPGVKWFNSHGHLVDTDAGGGEKADFRLWKALGFGFLTAFL